MKRKGISKKIRFEIFKRDSFKCQYCGEEAPNVVLHVDHIQPVSKDGSNDLLNLITSCVACNLGKSATPLSDQSTLHKQKEMLNELNEKREQLEMLIQWKDGMNSIKDMELNAAVDYWHKFIKGYSLNELGRKDIASWLRKFSLQDILEAMDKSNDFYIKLDENGKITHDSVDISFRKIGALLNSKDVPEYLVKLFYIRGIARNRLSYFDDSRALKLLEAAFYAATEGHKTEYFLSALDELKSAAFEAKNWSHFVNLLNEIKESYSWPEQGK